MRLAPGKTESKEPGYSIAEVKKKLETTYRRVIVLKADGTYDETFANRTNHGDWTRAGDELILNDTDSNGVPILPKLQKKKKYRLADGGREIITEDFGGHGLELVFTKKP